MSERRGKLDPRIQMRRATGLAGFYEPGLFAVPAGCSDGRMKLTISRLEPNDLATAQELAHDAGLGGAAPFLPLSLSCEPDGYLLARDEDGRPAACVGAQRYGDVAFIGAMCVARRLQRKGVGAEILRHLIQELQTRGTTGFLLEATPAGAGLYEKLGFSAQFLTHVWRAPEASFTGVRDTCERISPRDVDGILALDESCFGAPRHNLLRSWLSEYSERAFCTHTGDGEPSGYITAGEARIGPWVAPNDADATRLFEHALTLHFSEPPVVYVPEPDRVATALVEARGFERVRTLTRMSIGVTSTAKPGLRALATAGFG